MTTPQTMQDRIRDQWVRDQIAIIAARAAKEKAVE